VNDLQESKRKVRSEFLELRNKLDRQTAALYSDMIFSRILTMPEYQKAKTVMFYITYGSEVITDGMILSAIRDSKTVAVPAITNAFDGEMTAVKLSKLEDAYNFVHGVRQPEIDDELVVEKEDIDLFFVPAIAFDLKGNRTGYGKGFFDRWLANVPLEKIAGIAFDFQVTQELPVGEHDLPVGAIVTEKRIIRPIKN